MATTSYYADGGDGWIGLGANNSTYTWDYTHDAAAGTSNANGSIDVFTQRYTSPYYRFRRGFIPIDTSGLTSAVTISAASLFIKPASNATTFSSDYSYVGILQSTQASVTALSNTDYDQCGAVSTVPDTASEVSMSGMVSTAYTEFGFNSTGLGWINKTGTSKFGARTGFDIEDVAVPSDYLYAEFHSSSTTGTSEDPYLEVTYTAGSTGFAHSQAVIIS